MVGGCSGITDEQTPCDGVSGSCRSQPVSELRCTGARAGEALELVVAAVSELDVGSGDEIVGCRRDEYFVWLGAACDSGAQMNGDAAWRLVAGTLDFAGVDACARGEPELVQRGADFQRAADRSCRAVEECKESVAGCVDLLAVKASEFASDDSVVLIE